MEFASSSNTADMPMNLSTGSTNPVATPIDLLGAEEQTCPQCGLAIKKAALKCRFCGHLVDPALRAEQVRDSAEQARVIRVRSYLRQAGVGWLIVAVHAGPVR